MTTLLTARFLTSIYSRPGGPCYRTGRRTRAGEQYEIVRSVEQGGRTWHRLKGGGWVPAQSRGVKTFREPARVKVAVTVVIETPAK